MNSLISFLLSLLFHPLGLYAPTGKNKKKKEDNYGQWRSQSFLNEGANY
jgi:hypothetical protein